MRSGASLGITCNTCWASEPRGTAGRGIVVRLSNQRAFLYKHGELVAVSPLQQEEKNTTGRYRVIGKDIDHRSSLYAVWSATAASSSPVST